MDLSQRRAQSVVDYLVKKGVSPDRLTAKGYGPDRPIADNDTRVGRAKNRRVQFVKVD
jgi:OOP family OmpA-OmpF porin